MKHNVYINYICNNDFNIEYTINNSDTEGGENPKSITFGITVGNSITVGNAHNKFTQLLRENYRYYYANYILYEQNVNRKEKNSKWKQKMRRESSIGRHVHL